VNYPLPATRYPCPLPVIRFPLSASRYPLPASRFPLSVIRNPKTFNQRAMRRYLEATLIVSLFALATAGAQPRFRLTSTDIRAGATIANKHVFNGMDCKGNNISPEVQWQGAPAGTKSYALTMYDPDAPTGSGWWH
jgi:hypothetical protein